MRFAKDEEEMKAIEAEEFGRIARNVARDIEGVEILDITGTSIQTCISGSGFYYYADRDDILRGHWTLPSLERNQAVLFGVEMYSRLNHNEELPCCSRCERLFIPSHAEREFQKRFGNVVIYQTEYASKSLCEICVVDIERMHRQARNKGKAVNMTKPYKPLQIREKPSSQLPEGVDQKAEALYKAEVFYRAASETEGIKITSFDEEKLQIELSLKAQFVFSFDPCGTADYMVSISPDTGQIIGAFLGNVEKYMVRSSISGQ